MVLANSCVATSVCLNVPRATPTEQHLGGGGGGGACEIQIC